MAKCEMCGKVGRSGNNVSHSKRRTKTRFLPNVQSAKITIDGRPRRFALCTRCLRTQSKAPRVSKA